MKFETTRHIVKQLTNKPLPVLQGDFIANEVRQGYVNAADGLENEIFISANECQSRTNDRNSDGDNNSGLFQLELLTDENGYLEKGRDNSHNTHSSQEIINIPSIQMPSVDSNKGIFLSDSSFSDYLDTSDSSDCGVRSMYEKLSANTDFHNTSSTEDNEGFKIPFLLPMPPTKHYKERKPTKRRKCRELKDIKIYSEKTDTSSLKPSIKIWQEDKLSAVPKSPKLQENISFMSPSGFKMNTPLLSGMLTPVLKSFRCISYSPGIRNNSSPFSGFCSQSIVSATRPSRGDADFLSIIDDDDFTCSQVDRKIATYQEVSLDDSDVTDYILQITEDFVENTRPAMDENKQQKVLQSVVEQKSETIVKIKGQNYKKMPEEYEKVIQQKQKEKAKQENPQRKRKQRASTEEIVKRRVQTNCGRTRSLMREAEKMELDQVMENKQQQVVQENKQQLVLQENKQQNVLQENKQRQVVQENKRQHVLQENKQQLVLQENKQQKVFQENKQQLVLQENKQQQVVQENKQQQVLQENKQQQVLQENKQQQVLQAVVEQRLQTITKIKGQKCKKMPEEIEKVIQQKQNKNAKQKKPHRKRRPRESTEEIIRRRFQTSCRRTRSLMIEAEKMGLDVDSSNINNASDEE